MSCEWEERVALDAGGDLAPAEARAVERHAAECESCRRLRADLTESLALVREAHAEPLEEAHFAAVRARVLAELDRRPARRWWAYALPAAAMALLAIAYWPRAELRVALPLPAAPAAPPIAKVLPAARQYSPRTEASETVLMKIETDDPDVVIYWIAESKGETK